MEFHSLRSQPGLENRHTPNEPDRLCDAVYADAFSHRFFSPNGDAVVQAICSHAEADSLFDVLERRGDLLDPHVFSLFYDHSCRCRDFEISTTEKLLQVFQKEVQMSACQVPQINLIIDNYLYPSILT